jgi:hypothetical protein
MEIRINGADLPLSMNHAIRHMSLAYHDYFLLEDFRFRPIRESGGWRSAEKDGHFDFSSVELRSSHPTLKEPQ